MTKQRKHIQISHRINSIVNWYIDFFVEKEVSMQARLAWKELCDKLNRHFELSGSRDGLNWVKRARLHYTRFITGNPLLEKKNVDINTVGLPKSLKEMNKLCIVGSHKHLRVLLTLLTVTRIFRLPPKPDLSSVTEV
jgi:hypothetical protein